MQILMIKVKLIIIEERTKVIMFWLITPSKIFISWFDEPTNNEPNAAEETRVKFDALRKILSSDSKFFVATLYSSSAISLSSK